MVGDQSGSGVGWGTLKPETIVLSYTGNGMIVFVTAQQMDEHFKKRHPGAEEE